MTGPSLKKQTFEELLIRIAAGEMLSSVLSSPRDERNPITKIALRRIEIKGRTVYQRTDQYASKVVHENLELQKCVDWLKEAFQRYRQGILIFDDFENHVLVSKKRKMTILTKAKKNIPVKQTSHNRIKNHVLVDGEPIQFLVELGVMTSEGKVIAKKYDKFRQINRFLEMVRDCVPYLPKGKHLNIVDFGCGKAYLTFAMYHYLHYIEGIDIALTGMDLKKDVIEDCQALADRLSYRGLKFIVGDIKDHEMQEKIDMMVALHACDIASDIALEKAVRGDVGIILCAPCCQHELYSQIKQPACDTLLRHGILRERFAALATDAVRADILVMKGYDVRLLEFIDMEHTPKNILIRAVKGNTQQQQKAAKERYVQFQQLLAIKPYLAHIL